MDYNDDEVLNINIDDLFKDPEEDDEVEETTSSEKEESKPKPSEMTKAMSNRINEVRAKTEKETRNAMAQEFGYEDYEAFNKAKEQDMLKAAGLDEEDIEPIIQKLLDKRFAEDPRMKRLEEFEAKEKEVFVKDQLKEINRFAGTSYKQIDELPPEVLAMWEKTGNLKQAYLAVQGESLIGRNIAEKQNGSTSHLINPGSSGTSSKVRPLTEQEKAIWKMVNPDLSEEELNKRTMPI